MANSNIPDIQREEWGKLISGEIIHEFKNYTLQVQLNRLQKKVKQGKFTAQYAKEQLFSLCSKYYLAANADLISIFKTW